MKHADEKMLDEGKRLREAATNPDIGPMSYDWLHMEAMGSSDAAYLVHAADSLEAYENAIELLTWAVLNEVSGGETDPDTMAIEHGKYTVYRSNPEPRYPGDYGTTAYGGTLCEALAALRKKLEAG